MAGPHESDVVAAERYRRDGFCAVDGILDDEGLRVANRAMDRVIAGEYATGVPPAGVNWTPGANPSELIKIDQPQIADHAITEVLVSSRIGEHVADLLGADMVQAWAVHLMCKPPRSDGGGVGWHQDDDYWEGSWEGEVLTCWLALGDVSADMGPVRFVPGSHQWGLLRRGDFFDTDLDRRKDGYELPAGEAWVDVPAVLRAGSATFHHRRVIHGSGPNPSTAARRSFVVHLRTERARHLPGLGAAFQDHLDDPLVAPVLFQRSRMQTP